MEQEETKRWERVRQIAKKVGFGEFRMIVQNGMPVRVENIIQQIRVDNQEEFEKSIK
jgi:hypothetical protein